MLAAIEIRLASLVHNMWVCLWTSSCESDKDDATVFPGGERWWIGNVDSSFIIMRERRDPGSARDGNAARMREDRAGPLRKAACVQEDEAVHECG